MLFSFSRPPLPSAYLAAPIGPVSLEMIQRGLKSGFLSSFVVRLGAAVGNLLCLLVSYYSIVTADTQSLYLCY